MYLIQYRYVMTYKRMSLKDARDNIAELIERVAGGNEVYVITKYGKPKVKVIKYEDVDKDVEIKRRRALNEAFGIWKDRKDITDSVKYARKLRKEAGSRYGKIFG